MSLINRVVSSFWSNSSSTTENVTSVSSSKQEIESNTITFSNSNSTNTNQHSNKNIKHKDVDGQDKDSSSIVNLDRYPELSQTKPMDNKTQQQFDGKQGHEIGKEDVLDNDWVLIQDEEDEDNTLLHTLLVVDIQSAEEDRMETESVFTEMSEQIPYNNNNNNNNTLVNVTSSSSNTVSSPLPPPTSTNLVEQQQPLISTSSNDTNQLSRRQSKKRNQKPGAVASNNTKPNFNQVHPVLAQMKDQELKMKKLRKRRYNH